MRQPIPLQTEEEFQLVKDYILLPVALDVLERDVKTLQTMPLKMAAVYIKALRWVQEMLTADLARTGKTLRECGIKVYEQRRTKAGIEAKYLCRGYHYQFSMLWGLVKAEVEKNIARCLRINLADG